MQLNKALSSHKQQAVLHGSWASALSLVDSRLDITILDGKPGGYRFSSNENKDQERKKIKNKLHKVRCTKESWIRIEAWSASGVETNQLFSHVQSCRA